MIDFRCPRCKTAIQKHDEEAGAKLACPGCGQRLRVPATDSPPAAPLAPAPAPFTLADDLPEPTKPAGRRILRLVGIFAAFYLVLGSAGAAYLLWPRGPKEAPAPSTPEEYTAKKPVALPTEAVLAPPPAEEPVGKFTSDELVALFVNKPDQVRRELLSKKVTVVLENIRWEVKDLSEGPDGVIEIFLSEGPQRTPKLFIRFGQSKAKIVARMNQYAASRALGEIVNFVITGRLSIKTLNGRQYLQMDDVALE